MWLHNRALLIIVVVFVLNILLCCNVWSAKVITLASDPYCPFICDKKTEGKDGYMVDVARIIFREAGYNLNLRIRPWSRAIYEVRSGSTDGIVACFKNHAPDFIFPTVNLGISQAKFYVRKDNSWRYHGNESLKKVKFGIVQDYDYSELKEYISKNPDKVDIVAGQNALAQNIAKIIIGRIGVIQDNETVVKYTLLKLKLNDKIVEAGYNGEPDIYYIAFSPKKPQSKIYAKILSDGIVRLRQKGQLKEILGRYGLNDWEAVQ